jgi:flavin-binding protein dodecin
MTSSSQESIEAAARDAIVRQMRDAIIDNDLKILQAVNQRLEFVDQQREDWMHGYLQRANRGPLTVDGLRELYEHLLELTKRETAR